MKRPVYVRVVGAFFVCRSMVQTDHSAHACTCISLPSVFQEVGLGHHALSIVPGGGYHPGALSIKARVAVEAATQQISQINVGSIKEPRRPSSSRNPTPAPTPIHSRYSYPGLSLLHTPSPKDKNTPSCLGEVDGELRLLGHVLPVAHLLFCVCIWGGGSGG